MPCFLVYCSREPEEAAVFSRRSCGFLQESTCGMDTLLLPSSSCPSCSSSCFLITLPPFEQTNSCHRNLRICTYSKTKGVAIKISLKNSYYQKKKKRLRCVLKDQRGWIQAGTDFGPIQASKSWGLAPSVTRSCSPTHFCCFLPGRIFNCSGLSVGFWPHDRGKESLFFPLCQSGAITKKIWVIYITKDRTWEFMHLHQ